MTMKTIFSRIFVITGAVAFALQFTAANATALTKLTPTNSPTQAMATPVAKANLAPAVANSAAAPAGAEDIRDIRQPKHVPTPWFWAAVAAGVTGLSGAAWLLWRRLRRSRITRLLPHEIALQQLAEARRLMDPEHAREYCFATSKIIRGYVEEQIHLRAPRLTTEEFLRELVEGEPVMAETHRALLGNFLQHCDLAKFAGWRYSLADLASMHASAIEFVQQLAAPAPTVLVNPAKTATAVQVDPEHDTAAKSTL
jgi:hypothetical protein